MRSSFAVCFLAVALCLVVCVSASTTVSKKDATTAVGGAKQSVMTVYKRAQSEVNKAKGLLDKVESSKTKAEDAKEKSQKASQDNSDAVSLAETIQRLSGEVTALYPNAQNKLEGVVKSLNTLLAEVQKLEGESTIEIAPNTDTEDDFSRTKTKATTLKGQADNLNERITNEVNLYAGVDATANEMEKKAKEAQLKNYHVSAIVAVAKIDTMLGNADKIIPQVEGKKNEVSRIVEEMKALQTNPTTVPDASINLLLQNADNELTAAKDAVDNAKIARTDIQTQKDTADAALTKVKAEKQEVSDANNEASTAEASVGAAQQIVLKLNTALLTATNSVTNAKTLKEQMETALSTATTAPRTKEVKEAEKSDITMGDGTEPDQKDTTTQPTSKDSLQQSGNSSDKLKDRLIKGAHNVPTTALTGGKAPAPGAKNDSAMTVSVPLLVALIASAVLQ